MFRRAFLQSTASLAAASAIAAAQEAVRAAPQSVPIRLGFDTYSLRAFRWKAMQLIEYAAEQRLDAIQISSLNDYESLDARHLAKVRERAGILGVAIDGGMGCICPLSASWNASNGDPLQNMERGLRAAKAVGAASMRCFMGSSRDRRGARPIEALMEKTIEVFRAARPLALDLGVRIALENHAGDMQAREARAVIEASGVDAVGSCLDTGNPMWVVEDPMTALETLAPYIVTTHIRDSAVYEQPAGAAAQWVALGDGSIDFHKFVARYRELCPRANMQLEIITGRPPRPLPYLEPDFWKAFPKANAGEFARFVALAKAGRPFQGFMVVEDGAAGNPPEFAAALRAQQKVDLERSIAYAKTVLGVGARSKS